MRKVERSGGTPRTFGPGDDGPRVLQTSPSGTSPGSIRRHAGRLATTYTERVEPRELGPAQGGGGPGVRRERVARAFVFATWSVLLLLAVLMVRKYGTKVPYLDDWNLVPYVTGEQPVTASWLWAQYSDHRFPLPKLILVTVLKLSGADFRAGMYLNVLALGGLALALTVAARATRGKTCYADAFLPIVLLQPGHAFPFLWTMVNTYVTPTVLLGLLLILIVTCRGRLSPSKACLFGLGLVGLCLSGTNGLIHVPALAAWLTWAGLRQWKDGGRRTALIALAGAAAALSVVGLYFIGFQRISYSPLGYRSASFVGDFLRGVMMFLAVNFGAAAFSSWKVLGPLTAVLSLVCVACLLAAIRRDRPGDRVRNLGLLAFLGGCLLLTLAVAWGRASCGPQWLLVGSYAIMAEPLLVGIYFAWEAAGPERFRTLGRVTLCTLVVALLPLEWLLGNAIAIQEARVRKGLERDMRARMPVYLLAKRNPGLFPFHDQMQQHLLSLHRAGFPTYRNVEENPPFREVRLPLVATATHEVEWQGGSGRATGNDPCVVVNLPERRWVCGMRFVCRVTNEQGAAPFFQVQWRERGREDFSEAKSYVNHMLPPGGYSQFVFYTDTWIDQICIRPDNQPCEFSFVEIVLLTPADGEPDPAVRTDRVAKKVSGTFER
jgi:hypothetical protein